MSDEDDIPPELIARVAESTFDACVKFDCGEEGVLFIDHQEVTREERAADCVIRMSKKNLEKLMTGKLNPMTAFLTGKMKVEGDTSVALRLQTLL